ncbi:hypothetical protein GIB67_012913 [Kingdonia uniflora]|uniref:non-specific serine/threonine protein kinase n=1 Tax=Kingdonia uniflora TaxID=39325 RepID=A0A7J7NFQ6_9MAGN|nr:hypothetical protein GIB67_012913 [Kingdonia uniflora]
MAGKTERHGRPPLVETRVEWLNRRMDEIKGRMQKKIMELILANRNKSTDYNAERTTIVEAMNHAIRMEIHNIWITLDSTSACSAFDSNCLPWRIGDYKSDERSSKQNLPGGDHSNIGVTMPYAKLNPSDKDAESFVEVVSKRRYGSYNDLLGVGTVKKVYRAFDQEDGIEVGGIREKHRRVSIKALKNWSRQILRGLEYLHTQESCIIHRDLKLNNIFINGNTGRVKIGDFGLSAVVDSSHVAHTVLGTPEFMAPKLYEENYTELVDIYAFGLCVLELVTREIPYSECDTNVKIYKKVTSGVRPQAMNKEKDPEVTKFIEKCLAKLKERPAAELLKDPFFDGLDDDA